MTIQDLKRNDYFRFNDEVFRVNRKWLNEDKPLTCYNVKTYARQVFDWEGLEIEKVQPPTSTDSVVDK